VRKRFVNPFSRASAEELPATDVPDMEASADSKLEKLGETDRASLDSEVIDEKAQSGTTKSSGKHPSLDKEHIGCSLYSVSSVFSQALRYFYS
jgi:hypothetical protein